MTHRPLENVLSARQRAGLRSALEFAMLVAVASMLSLVLGAV